MGHEDADCQMLRSVWVGFPRFWLKLVEEAFHGVPGFTAARKNVKYRYYYWWNCLLIQVGRGDEPSCPSNY